VIFAKPVFEETFLIENCQPDIRWKQIYMHWYIGVKAACGFEACEVNIDDAICATFCNKHIAKLGSMVTMCFDEEEKILYNYYSNKMHTFFIIKITRYYNL
jgi:hypothetical protein